MHRPGLGIIGLLLAGALFRSPASAAEPIRVRSVGLATPDSVLFDPVADVYLVSNVRGDPLAKDDDGFISRLAPDGKVLALRWIDGAARGVTLNAPKGMAIVGDQLWVADIDRIRRFDLRTGSPRGRPVAIRGATCLDDLAVAPDGSVYCTDTGLRYGKGGLLPSGSQALYKVTPRGKVAVLLNSGQLGNPKGVAVGKDRLWLAGLDGELTELTLEGRVLARHTPPAGGLDGVVVRPDGAVLVSSFLGRAIYALGADAGFTTVASDLDSPADIGWDPSRGRLLVPLFDAHEVRILP